MLYLTSFDQAAVAANQGVAGRTQRLLDLEIHAWFLAMGWRAAYAGGLWRGEELTP